MGRIKINTELLDESLQINILTELAQNIGTKTLIAALASTRGIEEQVELHNLCQLEDEDLIIMDRLYNLGSNHNLRQDIFLLITQKGLAYIRSLLHK